MAWKERLGEELRRARKRVGMTQEEVRQSLIHKGLTLSLVTLGSYERGETAPDFDDLRKFAAVLGTDHFQVDEYLRIEFRQNGRARPEALPQQLTFEFDEEGGVTVRIQPGIQGLVISRKISA